MGKLDRQRIPDEVQAAATHLEKAYRYALALEVDLWELALPLRHLVELGVEESDLRWLVLNGYAEHGEEITTFRDTVRRFRRRRNTAFTAATCFVCTEAGARLVPNNSPRLPGESGAPAQRVGMRVRAAAIPVLSTVAQPSIRFPEDPAALPCDTEPHWDRVLRVLRLGGEVVKRFRQPSPNQETLLTAFQELGWPERIDDPLPPQGELVPKHRLHFTIWRLNQHQEHPLLRFLGDGTGEGICWRRVAAVASAEDGILTLRRAA